MSVESKPNKLVKGLVLDTFHTDVDNTVATYALNSQLEDQEGNHFHYGSEVGTTYIKEIPTNHVVIGHINMERNETVLFTTDGTNSTIGILSRNDDMSYNYEIKVDDTKQAKKLNFKKDTYIRGVYRLLNGCDKVIYFVDGINKDRRININKLDSYKTSDTASIASGIIFDDSLRATIYSLSSATGNIQLIRLMSANAEATANALANLSSGESITKLLDASANGIGTAFANLMRTANLISSTNATGTTTSNVDIIRLLQGNVTAIGSVNATLESITQGLVEIEVSLTGVASTTAALLRAALLESTLTTQASTVVEAILTRVINAQVQASADTSSSAQITIPVNASATATAVTAADALLSYAVNATVNAMANTSATAQLSKVITASANALASSSSEALIGLVLISTTSATGSVSSANLFISRLLASSVTAQGTTTAQLLIAELLSSTVTSQATTTGNILLSKLMSSNATSNATSVASLLISDLLNSSVNGIATSTTNLTIADLLSSTITGTATTQALLEAITAIVSDPYIDNVSLLLQGDNNPTGVTQNNTFIDSSTNNFTITRNGNVTQGTFSPFDKAITNSGGSAYFDGTGDYLSTTANNALVFGTSGYTIETWVNQTARSTTQWIIGGGGGFQLGINTSGFIFGSVAGGSDFTPATIAVSLNIWTHISIVRNNTSAGGVTYYINGVAAGTAMDSTNYTTSVTLNIGTTNGNTGVSPLTGYLSNLRVVKGTAVYTSNFQPSTTPLTAITNTSLLLNFNNAAIFDAVKNNNVETIGNASINTSVVKYGTGSLSFDGTGDYLISPVNSNFEFGTSDFTIETWVRFNNVSLDSWLINIGQGISGATPRKYVGWAIRYTSNTLNFIRYDNTETNLSISFTAINNTWYHIAISRSGTNLRFFVDGNQLGATFTNSTNYNRVNEDNLQIGYALTGDSPNYNNVYFNGYIDDLRITKGIARYTSNFTVPSKLPSLIPNYLINRSLRFSSSRSTYLSRTPTVAGNRKTWTWSGWVKRAALNVETTILGTSDTSSSNNANVCILRFLSGNGIRFVQIDNSGFASILFDTNTVFRDISTWYHIVLALDTTQATNSNGLKLYVNNILQTGTYTNYTQNYDTSVNSISYAMYLGRYSSTAPTSYFDGYMAEVNFIDGQALTPTSFGELSTTTGTWIPKLYTGTYGTNGFRLKFSDLTQLGEDFSGNLNNWTPNNFTTTPGANYDLMSDTPINADETIGNYATLNPLEIYPKGTSSTISNGNLTSNSGASYNGSRSTILFPSTGKWYAEFNCDSISTYTTVVGILGKSGNSEIAYYSNNGNKDINGTTSAYGASYTTNDIIGVAVDCIANTITFYKNNVSQGAISIPFDVTQSSFYVQNYNSTVSINFGQRPFVYTPPTGFKTLNTSNLPTPAIGATAATQANKFMDISLYTGTGASQSVFNSGAFQPDLVWIKNRTGSASNHALYDSVRGVTKQLVSNTTAAETTEATGLTSFNSNGFTIGALGQINTSGSNYIAWQWKASGTTVANTAGTIASTVSVNTTAGFSIVSYTGTGTANQTVGHGLGVVPSFVIIKDRDSVISYSIYHRALGANSNLEFSTATISTFTGYYNGMSDLFIGLGSIAINTSGKKFIAYAWAEINGFSKFDSYVGNGSADGVFVYTGFRPKFILIKGTGVGTNWAMYNSIVDTSNPVNDELLANSSNNENSIASNNDIDFLSNGFKLRGTDASINTSAVTYIYGAFAEFPLKYANAALTERVRETIQVDYLVIAGGGGGGYYYGAGGGAGGYRSSVSGEISGGGSSVESSLILTKGNSYTITVGNGGDGANSSTYRGTNGSNSIISGTGITTITSIGGGGGGGASPFVTGTAAFAPGLSGGSGGGAGGERGSQLGGEGTTGQGYRGENTPGAYQGGGGGAGEIGGTDGGKQGGDGVQSSITGNPIYRAGGGAGGSNSGGQGGGGNGGVAGTPNSGGGGGGDTTANGMNGGSGVIIIRYPNTEPDLTLSVGIQYATSNGTVTTSITTAGQYAPSYTTTGFKVYEFRGTGGVPLNITW